MQSWIVGKCQDDARENLAGSVVATNGVDDDRDKTTLRHSQLPHLGTRGKMIASG